MLLKIVKDLPIFMCCFIHQSGFSDSSVGKKSANVAPEEHPILFTRCENLAVFLQRSDT